MKKVSALRLGLAFTDRAELYARIDLRVRLMVKDGLLEEIREVLNSGIPEKSTAMQAIGYKEFLAALHGDCTIDEAITQVQLSSRHYAKRQLTWFRRDERINWICADNLTKTEVENKAKEICENFYKQACNG